MLAALLLPLILLGACSTNPVTGAQDFVLMSEDQEIALGRQYHQSVLKQYKPYDAPELQRYIQRIGDKLAKSSHRSNLVFRFTLVDSTDVNAFALPGGYIYITRGLLAYLNSEAELAAVLGHEIGHVTARHSVRRHSTATATGLLGSVVASRVGVSGAQSLANVIGTAVVRGYGREHELESDRLGAEYLARSGYDPNAMIRVVSVLKNQELFEKLRAKEEKREPRAYHGLFSTHPENDHRFKKVVQAAKKYQTKGYVNGSNTFKQHLEGLVFGPSADQGVVRNNRFYHTDLDIGLDLPKGWKVENRSDELVAKSAANDGWFSLKMQDINRRIEPRAFITKRLGLKKLQHGEQIDHKGLRGYTAITQLSTPYGKRKGRITVLYHDRNAYIFKGAAKGSKKPYRYDQQFLNTARSFHTLSNREHQLAQPQQLHIRTANSKDRFSSLAAKSPIPEHAEEQLRLLNALYPDGEPKPGTLIKLVR
ncbi:M48 family metalloprotease [Candidatus Reidiella endopervernicosa]|uniref:M48 family metalloprotease n=1 Tax=Candidatus Reidiella endopervernicosa TaxID=2738883 RepID=A0A6N0I0N8_9GAMM|nr:M48 family metalloprotease [Candidatus Reidiella endopervernicosa]